MTTIQEQQIAAFKADTGETTGTYNELAIKFFQNNGATASEYNAAALEYAHTILDSTAITNVNEALNAVAIAGGATNWSSFGTPTTQGGGGVTPLISPIRTFEVTMGDTDLSAVEAITAVDKDKSYISFLGSRAPNGVGLDTDAEFSKAVLTDGETVTISKAATGSGAAYVVRGQVIALRRGSVQHGTVTIANGSLTNSVALSTQVTPGRSAVNHQGATIDADHLAGAKVRLKLDATGENVVATRGNSTGTVTVSWAVIELPEDDVVSRNQVEITVSSGSSNTATITEVNPDNVITFFGGHSHTDTDADESLEMVWGYLQDGTTSIAKREGTSATVSGTIVMTHIELIDGLTVNRQTGEILLDDNETGAPLGQDDVVLSGFTGTSGIILNVLGEGGDSDWRADTELSTLEIVDKDTLRIQRGYELATGRRVLKGYEAVEMAT